MLGWWSDMIVVGDGVVSKLKCYGGDLFWVGWGGWWWWWGCVVVKDGIGCGQLVFIRGSVWGWGEWVGVGSAHVGGGGEKIGHFGQFCPCGVVRRMG